MITKFFSRKATPVMPMFANTDAVVTEVPERLISEAIDANPILPVFSPKTVKIFKEAARTMNFAPLYAEVRAVYGCNTESLTEEQYKAMMKVLHSVRPGLVF